MKNCESVFIVKVGNGYMVRPSPLRHDPTEDNDVHVFESLDGLLKFMQKHFYEERKP